MVIQRKFCVFLLRWMWSPTPRSQVWSPVQSSQDKNLWTWPSPIATVAMSFWIKTGQFPDFLLCKIPILLSTLEHPNQSPNATIPVGIFCLEAIKIGCWTAKTFGSPLSWPTVLTACPTRTNFILLSCLMSGNSFPTCHTDQDSGGLGGWAGNNDNDYHSVLSDSATSWAIQSMEFSRPEYWSG